MINLNKDVLLKELLKIFNYSKKDVDFNLEDKFYLASLSEKKTLSAYEICHKIYNDIYLKVIVHSNSVYSCKLIIDGKADYIRNQIEQNFIFDEKNRILKIMDNYIKILNLFIDKKRYPDPVISGALEIEFIFKNDSINLTTVRFIDTYTEEEKSNYSYYPDGIVVMTVPTSHGRSDVLMRMLDDYCKFIPPYRELGFIYHYITDHVFSPKLRKMQIPVYEGINLSDYLDCSDINDFITLYEILEY